jgi:hypothetical protein
MCVYCPVRSVQRRYRSVTIELYSVQRWYRCVSTVLCAVFNDGIGVCLLYCAVFNACIGVCVYCTVRCVQRRYRSVFLLYYAQ